MPIKGITDLVTTNSYYPPSTVAIKLFKGEEKSPKAPGRDLQSCFRVEIKHEGISKIVKREYGESATRDGGAVRPKFLNIYLPYNHLEENFPSCMEVYSNSGCMLRCDGETIYERLSEVTDPMGNVRLKKIQTSEPCQMKDGFCKYGCQKSGKLFFHIQEVFNSGYTNKLGVITVHSYSDLLGITTQLANYLKQMGSLCSSPFPSPFTSGYIPFVLSRMEKVIKRPIINNGKRTGKSSNATTWTISLDINPEWLAEWIQWQKITALQQLGLKIEQHHLKGYWREPLMLSGSGSPPTITVDARYQPTTIEVVPSNDAIPPLGEPWKNWKTREDAIAWAKSILPHSPIEQINFLFDSTLPDETGKKAIAFTKRVYQLVEF